MKTLIFNGSPRKNGDTLALVNEFSNHLDGKIKIVNAYESNIKPCIDCRYCWEHAGCSISDEMMEVYAGQLLAVASRLQSFFCARFFRQTTPIPVTKKGGVILVGGGDGSIEKAYETATTLLRHMNAKDIAPVVFSHNTNTCAAINDTRALVSARKLADFFKKGNL